MVWQLQILVRIVHWCCMCCRCTQSPEFPYSMHWVVVKVHWTACFTFESLWYCDIFLYLSKCTRERDEDEPLFRLLCLVSRKGSISRKKWSAFIRVYDISACTAMGQTFSSAPVVCDEEFVRLMLLVTLNKRKQRPQSSCCVCPTSFHRHCETRIRTMPLPGRYPGWLTNLTVLVGSTFWAFAFWGWAST